ncbi:hypothetical protein [Streptomyces avermitilis]|uniref:hypothetical protein n=1 Tax=Streptomyces avermitilis TaxID=33903 RepID=UPI0033B1F312
MEITRSAPSSIAGRAAIWPTAPQGDHATWFHARQVGAHAVAAAQSAHGVRVTDDALVSALKSADAGSA